MQLKVAVGLSLRLIGFNLHFKWQYKRHLVYLLTRSVTVKWAKYCGQEENGEKWD